MSEDYCADGTVEVAGDCGSSSSEQVEKSAHWVIDDGDDKRQRDS